MVHESPSRSRGIDLARRAAPLTAILAATLFAHGLLLLNPGVYWDDWVLLQDVNTVSREQSRILAMSRGIPTDMILWRMVGPLPNMVASGKLLVVALLATIGLLAYRGARLLRLPRGEATAAGCIAVAYPACQTWVLFITTNGAIYFFLFMLGSVLALSANRPSSSLGNLRRATAALLLFLSYGLNSLLVVALGLCQLLLLSDREFLAADSR